MANLELPPIIAALDFADVSRSKQMIRKLGSIGPEILGFKIPAWHNQHLGLLDEVATPHRFVVSDTRIWDEISKMSAAVTAFASSDVGEKVSAITIHPTFLTEEGITRLREEVVGFVHAKNIAVIGYTGHDGLDHKDEAVHHRDAAWYGRATKAEFDAFEVHDSTAVSGFFEEEKAKLIGSIQPRIIVSKFGDDNKTDKEIAKKAAEALNSYGAAVYLGSRLIEASDPAGLVNRIIEARVE